MAVFLRVWAQLGKLPSRAHQNQATGILPEEAQSSEKEKVLSLSVRALEAETEVIDIFGWLNQMPTWNRNPAFCDADQTYQLKPRGFKPLAATGEAECYLRHLPCQTPPGLFHSQNNAPYLFAPSYVEQLVFSVQSSLPLMLCPSSPVPLSIFRSPESALAKGSEPQ
ncbi:hypothetical protein E5288_WYG008024 [Bos mutus]|uniref:Uncharacterized protein n=1 Tax=Bos mutus TaxID=72004 RepID=A0A6B0RZ80_9CETA|nr:hypothetical protein [Bos mutus]